MIINKAAFLITVYKNDSLINFKLALESIIHQSYNFENINIYLGIDGCLSDNVKEYIEINSSYFYKILINKNNMGLAYTLNKLIDLLGDEKYIFRMDSDDISDLDRVKKQIKYLENNIEVEILGGSIQEFNDISETEHMIRSYPKSTNDAKKYICKASIFAHPAVCFRSSFLRKGFRYDNSLRFSQDLDLWFKAVECNINISNLDDIILKLRISNNFYNRRNYKKAFGEFKIYIKGIYHLYGITYRFIYPIIRLFSRLFPPEIVKVFYKKRFRNYLNKTN